jgi:ubiquinone/menaquinone biosynthesis C-methylase UbiE
MAEQTVDLEAVKQVQQKVWSEGDFAMIAGLMSIVGEELSEAADIYPDERVLDVACGSGNTTIPAARRAWGNTVGLDYVPELLKRGRERAAAERLEIEFVEGDAENMPFEDASFDVVLSSFGVMFAPDHQKAADELLRVCKPGGRIGMANWVPDGFVGEMFITTAKHAAPPPGVQPPILWGTEDHLRDLFGDGISSLEAERTSVKQRFRSADHWIEFFRTYFGPTRVAFERVGEEGADALESDLRDLLDRHNVGGDRALIERADYLRVIATRA